MFCPFCKNSETKVTDSRLVSEGSEVRRRRECSACGERFTSYEVAALVMPRIIKNDGRSEPFDEIKLRGGMEKALQKRVIANEKLEAAMQSIMHKLRTLGERETTSAYVGELVMAELKKIDKIAYVRFASVYRSFQDIKDFSDEIKKL